jgi:hypothetical protein
LRILCATTLSLDPMFALGAMLRVQTIDFCISLRTMEKWWSGLWARKFVLPDSSGPEVYCGLGVLMPLPSQIFKTLVRYNFDHIFNCMHLQGKDTPLVCSSSPLDHELSKYHVGCLSAQSSHLVS